MRIVGVEARVIRWPIEPRGAARTSPAGRGDRATAGAAGGARGAGWTMREAVIVGVRGDGGETGLGEAAPLPGRSLDELADALAAADALEARVPFSIESPRHVTSVADRTTIAPAARFALESALAAALAQHTRTRISRFAATMPLGELAVAHVVTDEGEAVRAVAAGARCLKLKAETPDAVRRIAYAAPSARLRVDANQSWPRTEVLAWLRAIADLPIDFVEEPCVDCIELLGEALPCKLALDESLVTLDRDELDRVLAAPELAALVIKPTILGGLARSFELAQLAHRSGVAPIVSHALEGPIAYAVLTELARGVAADVPVGLGPHPALDHFWEHAR